MKSKTYLNYLLMIILLATTRAGLCQKAEEKDVLKEGTIEEQINYVVNKSHMYEEYRVIKSVMFNKLKKNLIDTMSIVRSELLAKQATISGKDVQMDSLNNQLADTQGKLDMAIRDKNSLKFIGINMSKTAYNSLVWLIISGLATGLIIFIIMFKRSHAVIRQLKTDLEETREEFEQHRKRALRREEEVVHKYHAELNKYKEKSRSQ